MSGIAGFFNPKENYLGQMDRYGEMLQSMSRVLRRRGPDDHGMYLADICGLAHTRLAVVDLADGHQPMVRQCEGKEFAIVCDGEVYNAKELRDKLVSRGRTFSTGSEAEVLLTAYMEFGPEFVKQVNGVFAIAIWDGAKRRLYFFRDRLGVKPLYYADLDGTVLFASELKGLFAYPGFRPQLSMRGLHEVFSLGPAKTYGQGTFEHVLEVLPGHFLRVDGDGIHDVCYWKLSSHPHEDNYARTVERTSHLMQDAICRQMMADVPVCTFLSGGVDSSLVSAVCARELKKQGKQLTTFSFDFVDNQKYFKANAFQPSLDRPYVEKMVEFLGSDHHYLECSHVSQADLLYDSVRAHDLPPMGDVDSSMLYFCSLVKDYNKVALTGECADEIFGGYPWFHKKECFEAETFPWTMDLEARKVLLSDEFLSCLHMDDYVAETYAKSVAETPKLDGDSPEEARRREISYLNLKWFMQTLLNRMDRTSMYCGLAARVPFADYRIVEYLWNVPWEMKARQGVVKGLLRDAGLGLVPEEILFRKKSPYPKTYDTHYEILLADRMRELLNDSTAPVMAFLDRKKVERFLACPSDYGKPWYGQLMAGPQMLAYLLQVNDWLKEYRIDIRY